MAVDQELRCRDFSIDGCGREEPFNFINYLSDIISGDLLDVFLILLEIYIFLVYNNFSSFVILAPSSLLDLFFEK